MKKSSEPLISRLGSPLTAIISVVATEMCELRALTAQYYSLRDSLKGLLGTQSRLEEDVGQLTERHGQLADRTAALAARQ